MYGTLDALRAALAADGETYHGGGGYYSPRTGAFYLFVQPSEYFTRQLTLHEATHQFHYLVNGNRGASGGWYVESLAEHFGMHDWDGAHLVTGTVPAIRLEDYPATALAHFDANGGDLAGPDEATPVMICDRPYVLLLVHEPSGAVLFEAAVHDPSGR